MPNETTMKQLSTLAFFSKHQGWNSFDKSVKKQIMRLKDLGFLEVFGDQARHTGKVLI
jgi:hypothetical protein